MRHRLIIALVFLIGPPGISGGLVSTAQAQATQYVTDSLRLETRTGPSTEHRIVSMLTSGTELKVFEESEGWTRVELPSGEEAWMLSRYLIPEPPPRLALARAVADLESLRTQNAQLAEELGNWRSMSEEVSRSRDALTVANEALSDELAELKRTAGSAVELKRRNAELATALDTLRGEHTRSEQSYAVLRASRERDWFLAGGGVLLGGMVIGLVIPKIRWKRRRSWGEL